MRPASSRTARVARRAFIAGVGTARMVHPSRCSARVWLRTKRGLGGRDPKKARRGAGYAANEPERERWPAFGACREKKCAPGSRRDLQGPRRRAGGPCARHVRHAVETGEKVKIFFGRKLVVEKSAMRHHSNVAFEELGRIRGRTGHFHAPRIGAHQQSGDSQKRGLPRPIRAEQRNEFSGWISRLTRRRAVSAP